MFNPIKVMDIELSEPIVSLEGLDNYTVVQGLVRLYGVPLGYVRVPVVNGTCPAATIRKQIVDEHSDMILRHTVENGLISGYPAEGLRIDDLRSVPAPDPDEGFNGAYPLVTVAVCTRNRTDNLPLCLDALARLDYPALDIVIVDNAPDDDATERLVCDHYPTMRYICEPRPGLDWARNRAILEARGEIVAYTDDDVVVDAGWARALARVFAQNPEVMAVTGLVVPYELETEAQWLMELQGGFGRGFERRWHRVNRRAEPRAARYHGGAGQFGTGANMAYRRSIFDSIGMFDPALDVGTVTNGGGDFDMFFRVLAADHTLVYEPCALVRHCHRREYARLRKQLNDNTIGFYSYVARNMLAYPNERIAFARLGVWWFWWWYIRRLLISLLQPWSYPRDLMLAEWKGLVPGLTRYFQARRKARKIIRSFGAQAPQQRSSAQPPARPQPEKSSAVRVVDLAQPLAPIDDVDDYTRVRVFVTFQGRVLGNFDIPNQGSTISVMRLRQVIASVLTLDVIEPGQDLEHAMRWALAHVAIVQRYLAEGPLRHSIREPLPESISVSVVIATLDRPDDLRVCLRHLCALQQQTARPLEIVVVDNNPASGLTPPVVADYPGVLLISELRKGSSYARNAGIAVSSGEIIVSTDDDQIVAPNWLEELVAPFARPDVMLVTGNVLPMKLDTPSQLTFETYGIPGRGFQPCEYDIHWFEQFRYYAVPTWDIGGTGNMACRASIFRHPAVGLLEESLGAGTAGVGEDTYLFYKVLKAGYTIVYQPTAVIWHRHRDTREALERQTFNYSKGHVAYHLTTLVQDGDFRALLQVGYWLPRFQLWRLKEQLLGRDSYPLSFSLLEIRGNLAGPLAFWRARRRVAREGRSELPDKLTIRREIDIPAHPVNVQVSYD